MHAKMAEDRAMKDDEQNRRDAPEDAAMSAMGYIRTQRRERCLARYERCDI